MPESPAVSVVVLNYNGRRFLQTCLESLQRQTAPPQEVLLVDNASVDDSLEYVRRDFPQVRIIQNAENLGYAGGNNAGWRQARGKYVFFLNPDTELDTHCLAELDHVVSSDARVGICGCKIKSFTYRDRIQDLGVRVDLFAHSGGNRAGEIDTGADTQASLNTFSVSGSAFLARKSMLETLNGFDARYFLYIEELDLCWRARLLGARVVIVPRALVYHVGDTLAQPERSETARYIEKKIVMSPRGRYFGVRNRLCTVIKNYQAKMLLVILPLFLLLIGVQVLFLLVTGKFALALAHLQAVQWNIDNMKSTLAERQRIQSLRRVKDTHLLQHMYLGSLELQQILANIGRTIGS